jgi:hypothetical protein
VSAWDELLAITHPGREIQIGAERWLFMRRSYERPEASLTEHGDRMTITVELVRAGSPADPRRLPADAPRPTNREDH